MLSLLGVGPRTTSLTYWLRPERKYIHDKRATFHTAWLPKLAFRGKEAGYYADIYEFIMNGEFTGEETHDLSQVSPVLAGFIIASIALLPFLGGTGFHLSHGSTSTGIRLANVPGTGAAC